MICPNCLESSQHAMCPYCGEVQIVGGLLDDVLSYVPTPGMPRGMARTRFWMSVSSGPKTLSWRCTA